jgi:hypothetical protein
MAADSRSICNSFALRYRTFNPDARAELLPAAAAATIKPPCAPSFKDRVGPFASILPCPVRDALRQARSKRPRAH